MKREDFIELTGEDPLDMFGPDFQNEIDDLELTAEDVRNHKHICSDCEGTGEVDVCSDFTRQSCVIKKCHCQEL